jgi:UDP-N-acetyl-D-mannosaminuronic acid dehydrogenase
MFDVCVIGCGRVGLPLLLAFADKGLKVAAVDIDDKILASIRNRQMPFEEPECQEVLEKHEIDTFHPNNCPQAKYYILTVGTPVLQHIETDLRAVESAVMNLINKGLLTWETTLILRSTVAPGTTQYVNDLLKKNRKDCLLAMCPERLAEGSAWEELHKLPQIIGGMVPAAEQSAASLFRNFGVTIHYVTPLEAELAKLFCNIYRYIDFAIPNYFMYLMNEFGVKDFQRMFSIIKNEYPRMHDLKLPGLTAGCCLRKDYGMINECFPQTDLLLQAYKINEFMPKFLVDQANSFLCSDRDVIVLGYTFKRDSDDTRDSLVPKLIRYLKRKNPKSIHVVEPHLPYGPYNDKFNQMEFVNTPASTLTSLEGTVVFVATNHTDFHPDFITDVLSYTEDAVRREQLEAIKKIYLNASKIVDIWGIVGKVR